MRTTRKFTTYVNLGALVLFVAAVVALLFAEKRKDAAANRGPASVAPPAGAEEAAR